MATETPLSPTELRETGVLHPPGELRADGLSALDHRSQRRAVLRDRALPGHYLSVLDADRAEWVLPLEGKVVHIGRAGTADLRLEDPRVSRRHAIVVRYGRHVRVLDDRSSAGTYVNGARVIATDLCDGDVVRLGPVCFTYVIVG